MLGFKVNGYTHIKPEKNCGIFAKGSNYRRQEVVSPVFKTTHKQNSPKEKKNCSQLSNFFPLKVAPNEKGKKSG